MSKLVLLILGAVFVAVASVSGCVSSTDYKPRSDPRTYEPPLYGT